VTTRVGPIRLMIVDTSPVNSGGAQLLFRYAKYFDPQRVQPTIVMHEDNLWAARYREARTADVLVETGLFQSNTLPPVRTVPMTTWLRLAGGAIGHLTSPFGRLVREIRHRHIDVIMGVCDTPAVIAALLGSYTGRPAVMHLVSTYDNRLEPTALGLMGRLPAVRRLLMLSHYSANYFAQLGRKVITIHSGIDLADFDGRTIVPSLRAARGIAEDQPLVGIAGRFVQVKGMDVFVRAAAQIAASEPRARFFMLGNDAGPYGDEVHALVLQLGLGEKVTFTGFVDDMHAALADLDIVVVPSRRESAPLVVYEAMALGKPVVASRVHGLPELVDDGVTGLLVPPEDDAATAKAVLSLLADPDRRRAMGQAAQRRVRTHFDLGLATKKMQDLLIEVASERVYPWSR
jgi:glycosyltransferase involved in cell wall biosynthesis